MDTSASGVAATRPGADGDGEEGQAQLGGWELRMGDTYDGSSQFCIEPGHLVELEVEFSAPPALGEYSRAQLSCHIEVDCDDPGFGVGSLHPVLCELSLVMPVLYLDRRTLDCACPWNLHRSKTLTLSNHGPSQY